MRLAFRKDPADADAIISAAKEKIQRYANGFLSGQNAEDEERDDDSEGEGDVAEGPEVDDLGTPYGANKNSEKCSILDTCLVNGKSKPSDEVAQQIGVDVAGKDIILTTDLFYALFALFNVKALCSSCRKHYFSLSR